MTGRDIKMLQANRCCIEADLGVAISSRLQLVKGYRIHVTE